MRLEEGMRRPALVALGVVGMSLGACGEEDGAVRQTFPVLDVYPSSVCANAGDRLSGCSIELSLAAGDEQTTVLLLKNSGDRSLVLKSVALEPGPGAEAFLLDVGDACGEPLGAGQPCQVQPLSDRGLTGISQLAVTLSLSPAAKPNDKAVLRVVSDAVNSPQLDIELSVKEGWPRIHVVPTAIDFGTVSVGNTGTQKIAVLNTGGADLVLTGYSFAGSSFFSAEVGDDVLHPGAEVLDWTGVAAIPPQAASTFLVDFAPEAGEPASANLTLFSNDPAAPEGKTIALSGNNAVPCLTLNPGEINFGGRMFGETALATLEMKNCGEAELHISSISVKDETDKFGVDLAKLDHVPSQEEPLALQPGAAAEVAVTYFSPQPNPLDQGGSPTIDHGTLIMENDSFVPFKEVPLSAAAVEHACPTAVVKVLEGDEVCPQTTIHLVGDQSYAPSGTIVKWQWEVDQPTGSQSVFVPSSTFPNPSFEANVAGVYTFRLTVFDSNGSPSCYPDEREVLSLPCEALHVELLWETPGDPDETDSGPEAGSDMDLHFLHPLAAGPDLDEDGKPDGWFDIPFDCYWFNAHPNWASFDESINDDPGLDRDDTDGAGPENINLDIPENQTYRIGVHYWNDHGYGASEATVRVYLYANLVYEAHQTLVDLDMWEACTFEWPSGKVTPVTNGQGQPLITPDYENPFFFPG